MSTMILFMFKFHSLSLSHFKCRFCYGGKSQIAQDGSMQLSSPEQQLDGGDANQWWTNDRLSMHLPPGGRLSTDSGDGGAHWLCSAHQSAPEHLSARYHHLSFITGFLSMWLDVPSSLLKYLPTFVMFSINFTFQSHFSNNYFIFLIFFDSVTHHISHV